MAQFNLKDLPYSYDALAPHISEETLKVHHDKHHQTYCDKFNGALDAAGITSTDIKEILSNVSEKPAIRNMGGGFWNHEFYWESMSKSCSGPSELPEMHKAIEESFGSFDKFKDEFSTKAAAVFGSGWTWLGVDSSGKLVIYNTANQDNFMMDVCPNKEEPVLVIDVWEHAYYIDYQNKRPAHIEEFFSVINWDKVSERYSAIVNK
jgi:Fe-Mn family superoxide dismutase